MASHKESSESNPKRPKLVTVEEDDGMNIQPNEEEEHGVISTSPMMYMAAHNQHHQFVEALQRNTASNDQLRLALVDMKHDLHLSQAIPTLASLGHDSLMIKEQVMEFNEGVRLTQIVNKALEANCLASIHRIDQDLIEVQKVLSRLSNILFGPIGEYDASAILENARACLRTYYQMFQHPPL